VVLCAGCVSRGGGALPDPGGTPGGPSPGTPSPGGPAAPLPTVTVDPTTSDGSARAVRILVTDPDGSQRALVAASGPTELVVVPGGAVTVIDVARRALTTWLDVDGGELLRDRQQPPPTVESGATTDRAAEIAGIAPNIRFLRAKVTRIDGGRLSAGRDLAASPANGRAGGMLGIPDGATASAAWRTLILYMDSAVAQVPSSWLFDASAPPISTSFDASRALPFLSQAQAAVDAAGRLRVSWHPEARLDGVDVGRISLTWRGLDDLYTTWEVRFPYRGDDAIVLPPLPPAIAAGLTLPSGAVALFTELALFDFSDGARAAAFLADMSAFGTGVVGVVRDLDHLGAAGVARMTFVTPF